jgi:hypothetical protein
MISSKLTNHQDIDFFSNIGFLRKVSGYSGIAYDFNQYDAFGNFLGVSLALRIPHDYTSYYFPNCSVSQDGKKHITRTIDSFRPPTLSTPISIEHRMWDESSDGITLSPWIIDAPSVALTPGAAYCFHQGTLRITKNKDSAVWIGSYTTYGASGIIDMYNIIRIFVDRVTVLDIASPSVKAGSTYSVTNYDKVTGINNRTIAVTKLVTNVYSLNTGSSVGTLGISTAGLNIIASCSDDTNSYFYSSQQSRLWKISNETNAITYVDFGNFYAFDMFSNSRGEIVVGNIGSGQYNITEFYRLNQENSSVEKLTGLYGIPRISSINYKLS